MLKNLDRKAIIRLVIFTLLMGWCVYAAVAYAAELNLGQTKSAFVDTSEIKDVYIDGSDFTWAVKLMGLGANGLLGLMYFIVILLYSLAEVIFTFVPTILLRLIGIRKDTVISKDEYRLTKYIYFTAIGISLVLGLIFSKFIGIITVLVFTGVWALIALIYVYDVKSRSKNPPID